MLTAHPEHCVNPIEAAVSQTNSEGFGFVFPLFIHLFNLQYSDA